MNDRHSADHRHDAEPWDEVAADEALAALGITPRLIDQREIRALLAAGGAPGWEWFAALTDEEQAEVVGAWAAAARTLPPLDPPTSEADQPLPSALSAGDAPWLRSAERADRDAMDGAQPYEHRPRWDAWDADSEAYDGDEEEDDDDAEEW